MIAELFEMPVIEESRAPLHAMREEVQRELSAAIREAGLVPDCYLDVERAQEMFRGLADDGDTSWARHEIIQAFEMSAGFAAHFDRMNDAINALSWAYWRLHRAERRAYGKEQS